MAFPFRTILAAIAVSLAAAAAHAQTADQLVAANIQAKGGAEKLKAVQSMKLTGRISGRGVEAPFTIWSKRPNMARQESQMQGTPMVRAFDGTTAWMMMGKDVQEITGPQAQTTREQAEFDSPLLDYKAKGHVVELVGPETVGGVKVFHLKLTTKGGLVQHYYMDPETGLERQTSITIDQGAEKMTLVTELSDYRDVDGIKVPFSVKQSVNGTPVTSLSIDKVQFNVPIDDVLFKLPRKQ